MDFDVLTNLVVTGLGAFDSGTDGINPSSTLTTQLYTRSGNSGTVLATLTFTAADPGTLVDSSRLKPLASPLVLSPGSYSIVSYGYDNNNRNGNLGTGNTKSWSTDDGGGLLSFVGGGRYGTGGPGTFPVTPDGGPADRYAAGTFEFRPVPDAPMIFVHPTNQSVRPNGNTNFVVGAAGAAPLRYQWSFNGTNLLAATNATLTITNAQLAQEGVYRVVVTNVFGSAPSAPASLPLLIDPIIVQPPLSQSVVSGGSVTLSVSVTNTATLPVGYRLRRNDSTLTNTLTILNQRTAFFTITGTNAAPPWTNYAIVVTNPSKPGGNLSASAILTYLLDSDGDGIPDEWEAAYGFSITDMADALLDADGDGLSNWAEYIAGTDPTNALSYLKIDSVVAGPGVTLAFGALSNKTYTVQYTDALGSGNWPKLADVAARPTNRSETIVDPNYTANRFYRIVTPQRP